METFTCQNPECGAEFAHDYKRGPRPKWCTDDTCRRQRESARHRAAYRAGRRAKPPRKGPWRGTRVCRYCGETFDAKASTATVCYEIACRRLKNNERARNWQRKYRDEHGKTYQHDKYPEYTRAMALKRKALLRGAPEASLVKRETLAERDGWGCKLCGEPIDPELEFPDPRSASIDHIRPVSLGGAHALDNVQLAHLGCNSRKKNRVDVP